MEMGCKWRGVCEGVSEDGMRQVRRWRVSQGKRERVWPVLRRSGTHKRCGEVEVVQIRVWEGRVGQPECGEGLGGGGKSRRRRLSYRPEGRWKHFESR